MGPIPRPLPYSNKNIGTRKGLIFKVPPPVHLDIEKHSTCEAFFSKGMDLGWVNQALHDWDFENQGKVQLEIASICLQCL